MPHRGFICFALFGPLGALSAELGQHDCKSDRLGDCASHKTEGWSMIQISQRSPQQVVAIVEDTSESILAEIQQESFLTQHEESIPGAIVVVAREEGDSLTWSRKLPGVKYVLETEIAEGKEYVLETEIANSANMSDKEYVKPRAYNGETSYECGGFLDFIVRQYANLPPVTVCLHGNPRGAGRHRHGDPHIFAAIRQIAADPDKVGYCSLNRESNWETWPDDPNGGNGDRWIEAVKLLKSDKKRFAHLIETVGPFRSDAGMKTYTSGQFAVSRARIQNHPVEFYTELLDWIMDAAPDKGHGDRRGGSTHTRCSMLEMFWHRIFGEAPALSHHHGRCAVVYGLDQV